MAQIANPPFLGVGWSFPPTFSRDTASIVMVADVTDIKQCLWILFSTSLGERLMLAGYGSALYSKVFAALTTTTANEIADIIRKAVLNWEPRIDVEDISLSDMDAEQGYVNINVNFIVRQTNVRSNLVYPFYLQEATLPPSPP